MAANQIDLPTTVPVEHDAAIGQVARSWGHLEHMATTVPVEHDAAIGQVARSWGHLEHMVDLALWAASDVEQQFGACLTAQVGSIHQKLRALGALVRLRKGSPTLLKKIEDFHAGLHDLGEKRARAVHDPRLTNSAGSVVRWQTTASSKAVIFGPQIETIADLQNLRRSIARKIKNFEAIKQEIRDELLTPGKRPLVTLQRIIENPPTPEDKTAS